MTDRPILRLPDSRPARRMTGAPARPPRPRGTGRRRQAERFRQEFERLEGALARDDAALELRRDPFGIAPERALVFVTAVPIGDFARAAQLVGLEVLSEIELDDGYDLPDDLIADHTGAVSPTLLAPSEALNVLTIGAASLDLAPAVPARSAGTSASPDAGRAASKTSAASRGPRQVSMSLSPDASAWSATTISWPGGSSRRATARTSRSSADTRGSDVATGAPAPEISPDPGRAAAFRIRICADARSAGVSVSR